MSSIHPMVATDLLRLDNVNIDDEFTTTFHIGFYLEYLAKWPQYCHVVRSVDGLVEGYIIGKSEASAGHQQPTRQPYDPDTNENLNYLPWHAHITALAIAPASRGQGLAERLTELVEGIANRENCWFVDLFVRADNFRALALYKKLGYSIFRKVISYYSDNVDAYDMRKSMRRDTGNKHVREKGETFEVDPSSVW